MTTALVTGATGGIGAAVTAALLEAGMAVICVGRRHDRLAALAARFGPSVRVVACDLAKPEAVASVLEVVGTGVVDVLVHTAGHDAGGGVPFADRQGDWDDMLAVNLSAAVALTRALLPGFLARDRGDVVAIGSIVTRVPAAGLAAYAATKHGLHGFMAGLRVDYAATGLRFTEITPGVVRSGFAARRLEDAAQAEAFYAGFAATLSPEDIARAVLFAVQQPAGCCVEEIVLMPTRR